MTRIRVIAAAVVLAAFQAVAGGGDAAAEVVATESAPTGVTAHGGLAIWSSRRPGGVYKLRALRAGVVSDLNTSARRTVFDVDPGPNAEGRTVLVYSRCRSEADPDIGLFGLPRYEEGRGCDLFRFDPDTGREQALKGPSTPDASEFSPAIWRSKVVFARRYEHRRGRRAQVIYLYSHDLRTGKTRRVPAGAQGIFDTVDGKRFSGPSGPVSIDLRGDRIAYSWTLEGRCLPAPERLSEYMPITQLWVVDGARRALIEQTCYPAASLSPQLSASGVTFFRTGFVPGRPPVVSELAILEGRRFSAGDVAPPGAGADDATQFAGAVLVARPAEGSRNSFQIIQQQPPPMTPARARLRRVRLTR